MTADSRPLIDARSFSEVLEDIGERPDAELGLDELVAAFGERGFGALLFLLGLISAVIGAVPGTTTVLGIPMLLIAVQLVFRRNELWLPKWALAGRISRAAFRDASAKVIKPLRKIERFSKPRLTFMNNDLSEALIGLACAIWAAVLMLPLIGFNLFPSLFVTAFGFGLVVWLAWEVVSRAMQASWDWASGLIG